MRFRTFSFAAASGIALLALRAGAVADEVDELDSRPLEIKHVDADGNVSVETSTPSRPKAPAKLVPFPEDEPAALKTAQPKRRDATLAEPKPLKAANKPSNFRPRFKTPEIRQTQHTEPVAADAPAALESPTAAAESTGPELQPIAAPASTNDSPGRTLLDEAFAKAKTCTTDSDYTAVINQCRQGVKAGLKKSYSDYARRLMGWAYNRRGELRAEAGKDKEALADFEASVKAGGTWRTIHNRGVSYAAQGRINEALADFDRAIELNDRYPNAYFNRGELKYEQGDFAGAIHDYTASLKLGPPEAATYNSRGHAFYRLQRFGDALRDYSESIRIDPTNATALINRGDTHSDMGHYADAAKDYRAAVQADPQMGRAYQSAAWLMATCPDEHYRNDKLAVDAANKAIELDGEDYRNLSTLAAAQASAGLFAEAKATQEKAIASAPRKDLVTAEKMMSLYQRDLAFRDRPSIQAPTAGPQVGVRQASATEPVRQNPPAARNRPGNGPPPRRPNPRGRY